MTPLAPDLFAGRRYDDLVQIGLSRLPGITPDWTDYNAHDPGITLLELLAAVSEAQLYSLSRMRRDERAAYAAMMGIEPSGTTAATGSIWPDASDPDAPSATIREVRVIERDWRARINGSDTLLFHPGSRILWVPATITQLQTRLADGTVVDQLPANRRGGPAFAPLGDGDGRGTVLRIAMAASGWGPILPTDRPDDAFLALGFLGDAGRVDGAASTVLESAGIEASLITEDGAFALPIRSDNTDGMTRTGVMLLDVSAVKGAPAAAVLELRAPDGLDRSPRLVRIDLNVIPVIQGRHVEQRQDSDGLPDQQFDLETPGLAFVAGAEPLSITVETENDLESWELVDRLTDCGPDDRAFSFDRVAARVRFGNGVNGAIPAAGATIVARYETTDGDAGNLASHRRWTLHGFEGTFGTNPERFTGGAGAPMTADQRRTARAVLREEHPLVSASDFKAAALALTGLEVGRARIVPASDAGTAPGVVCLLAMRARRGGLEPKAQPEPQRWLDAVHRRLSPRVLLGAQLKVAAPTYVDFTVAMTVHTPDGIDPKRVRRKVIETLIDRLTLVAKSAAMPAREFGQPLSTRDLAAWIKSLPDVRSVSGVEIRPDGGGRRDKLVLPAIGLPRIDLVNSIITVVGTGKGETS